MHRVPNGSNELVLVGPRPFEEFRDETSLAGCDGLAIHENLELSEASLLELDFDSETFTYQCSETRRFCRAGRSRIAVDDSDRHEGSIPSGRRSPALPLTRDSGKGGGLAASGACQVSPAGVPSHASRVHREMFEEEEVVRDDELICPFAPVREAATVLRGTVRPVQSSQTNTLVVRMAEKIRVRPLCLRLPPP